MSKVINHNNYEAFYLDYLEGTLSPDDAALLMAFLDQHPELRMDDDFMPVLSAASATELDWKKDLKVFDAEAMINTTNAEEFMIASLEGDLKAAKQKELDALIAATPGLAREMDLFRHTLLKADPQLVYPDKHHLKQARIIPLYAKFSAAAACAALAIGIWSLISDPISLSNDATFVASHFPNAKTLKHSQEVNTQLAFEPSQDHAGSFRHVHYQRNLSNIEKLPVREAGELIQLINDHEPVALNIQLPLNQDLASNPTNDSKTGFTTIYKPIEPISKTIKQRFDKEVEYAAAKDRNGNRKGFFLKIGKLEISRNLNASKHESLAGIQ